MQRFSARPKKPAVFILDNSRPMPSPAHRRRLPPVGDDDAYRCARASRRRTMRRFRRRFAGTTRRFALSVRALRQAALRDRWGKRYQLGGSGQQRLV